MLIAELGYHSRKIISIIDRSKLDVRGKRNAEECVSSNEYLFQGCKQLKLQHLGSSPPTFRMSSMETPICTAHPESIVG